MPWPFAQNPLKAPDSLGCSKARQPFVKHCLWPGEKRKKWYFVVPGWLVGWLVVTFVAAVFSGNKKSMYIYSLSQWSLDITVWTTLFSLLNICNPQKVQSLAIGQVNILYIVGGFNKSELNKSIVKLDHLPRDRVENNKSLKPPPSIPLGLALTL